MEVKSVKAVTELTVALSASDAAKLMNILNSCVMWNETPTGTFAKSLYESLSDAGVLDSERLLKYDAREDFFVERKP